MEYDPVVRLCYKISSFAGPEAANTRITNAATGTDGPGGRRASITMGTAAITLQ